MEEAQSGGLIDYGYYLKLGLIIFLIMFATSSYVSFIYTKKNYECYISHVKECLDCHRLNDTYLLCSGFCATPREQDLDGLGCSVVHPTKDCFDLPKECNL